MLHHATQILNVNHSNSYHSNFPSKKPPKIRKINAARPSGGEQCTQNHQFSKFKRFSNAFSLEFCTVGEKVDEKKEIYTHKKLGKMYYEKAEYQKICVSIDILFHMEKTKIHSTTFFKQNITTNKIIVRWKKASACAP